MINRNKNFLLMGLVLTLSACGGGGDPSQPGKESTTSGTVSDSFYKTASVLCDTNGNGAYNIGEANVPILPAAPAGAPAAPAAPAGAPAAPAAPTLPAAPGSPIPPTITVGTFTFSTECSSNLYAIAFLPETAQSQMSAVPGSSMITPLTSLMTGSNGMSSSQIATTMNLPAGTDVSQTNPAGNLNVQQATLATVQITNQINAVMATLAQPSSPSAPVAPTPPQALYDAVASAMVTVMGGSGNPPLMVPSSGSSGAVSPTVIAAMVQQAIANVMTSNNPALAPAKSKLGGDNSANIATLVSGAIAAQAQQYMQNPSSAASLSTLSTALQPNNTIASTVNQLVGILTANAPPGADFSALGKALTAAATATATATPAP